MTIETASPSVSLWLGLGFLGFGFLLSIITNYFLCAALQLCINMDPLTAQFDLFIVTVCNFISVLVLFSLPNDIMCVNKKLTCLWQTCATRLAVSQGQQT